MAADFSPRKALIAETLWFTRQCRMISGVRKIALIGSLVTHKQRPKDTDLLVYVPVAFNLAALAKLGRQLQGHTQSMGLGGEVFLASDEEQYLGRLCPWRECGRSYRASCDANNCGVHEYLHDDFRTVRLNQETVHQPPVVLWPSICAVGDIPEDVRTGLLMPLMIDATAELTQT